MMYKIVVANKRTHEPTQHDHYCGRPSPLGNQYTHVTKNTLAKYIVGTREEAVQKYRDDFPLRMGEKDFRDAFF